MEVVALGGPVSSRITVTDSSHVGEARRAAHALTAEAGLSSDDAGVVAVIVTEAATNLVRHAHDGIVVMRILGDVGRHGIEILAYDKGPGIRDVTRAMSDGHSTGGTRGQGLGAIRRLAHEFDIFSRPETGTALVARVWSAAARAAHAGRPWAEGVVCLPIHGETSCGDAWDVDRSRAATRVVIADGLGHGVEAALAASEAIRAVRDAGDVPPAEAVRAAHDPLRATRGAALAVGSIDVRTRSVRFAGVGNIIAAIVSPDCTHQMASHNGIVGHRMTRVQEFTYPWTAAASVVMHSDGLSARWRFDAYPGLTTRDPALIAAVLHRDYTRGRDDATTIVVRDVEA